MNSNVCVTYLSSLNYLIILILEDPVKLGGISKTRQAVYDMLSRPDGILICWHTLHFPI